MCVCVYTGLLIYTSRSVQWEKCNHSILCTKHCDPLTPGSLHRCHGRPPYVGGTPSRLEFKDFQDKLFPLTLSSPLNVELPSRAGGCPVSGESDTPRGRVDRVKGWRPCRGGGLQEPVSSTDRREAAGSSKGPDHVMMN